MAKTDGTAAAGQSADFKEVELPPGDHALEVAARAGIGPLSPLGQKVWHGRARPCVSCGQLVHRDSEECNHCGQDLSDAMLDKMRAHAGPWDVLEHVRPFPGVSLDRIIRQIRRGVLSETSIVRGPATDFQWRFAVETPGLCRYFDRCWNCSEEVSPEDTHCPACLSHLTFEQPRARATQAPQTTKDRFNTPSPGHVAEPLLQPTPPIQELTTALGQADATTPRAMADAPPRVGRISVAWVIGLMLAAVIILLVWFTQVRSRDTAPESPSPATMILPLPDKVD